VTEENKQQEPLAVIKLREYNGTSGKFIGINYEQLEEEVLTKNGGDNELGLDGMDMCEVHYTDTQVVLKFVSNNEEEKVEVDCFGYKKDT
tara:strand:- start:615 stop:884 length:270 start_codon:yes stop_codon:yes gene_type:complete